MVNRQPKNGLKMHLKFGNLALCTSVSAHSLKIFFFSHHLRHTILKKSAVLHASYTRFKHLINSNPGINIMAVFAVTYKTGCF